MNPKNFLGGALVVVGFLMFVLSGGCSLVFGFGALFSDPPNFAGLPFILVFGGIPFVVGLLLFLFGMDIYTRKPPE